MEAVSLQDVAWCAAECERQQSGEASVSRMVSALHHARVRFHGVHGKLDTEMVRGLANLIEPRTQGKYRTTPVIFMGGGTALHPDLILQAILTLVRNAENIYPEDFYQEFEAIHPFIDGNGRVGAILYNWMVGSLLTPITPPEYKP